MDKKTFQPGDFYTILADKMQRGLGDAHHGMHSEVEAQRCASGDGRVQLHWRCYNFTKHVSTKMRLRAAVTQCMRHTLPVLQSTIEQHTRAHQSMVQVLLPAMNN
jgi:hypothetical protein